MIFLKQLSIILFLISILSVPVFSSAQVLINPNLPGAQIPSTNDNPCALIINFYWFAIFISGILAFGAIVWGGIKYQIATGNPSGQSEGKKWIMGALEGLLLLFGAYLILKIINPGLTKCQLPELSSITPENTNSTQPNYIPTGGMVCNNTSVGIQGTSFTDSCYPITSVSCKSPSFQPHKILSCSASIPMNAVLSCMAQKLGSGYFMVTEAMPPTVDHKSHCHTDGCCVDTVLRVTVNQANLNRLISTARLCGAGNIANEYKGLHGTVYSTTKGDNVHIQTAGCN